ncbi:WbqC family protein [Oleiagrimonas sp. MCCC 1A03011]|uniref:WbqC family protein n=1 Tax=Oleiagrimonas sp. MCCC 1A03011 TaxID=1926883 RepID=UPI000DC48EDE|nr:WbqC family protein [Oleiagrimonas sp. MCCC 1A03011]RAP59380.1 hypothetical protein BTJ49_01565 [Oleiagrimonas sp. MCCC 1A03011]
MIAAIMQPYLFPYIGYFQLMHAVDIFVFYDDVKYIKSGWVNRNRLRIGNRAAWFTLPIKRDRSHLSIHEREYRTDEATLERLLRTIWMNYSHTSHGREMYDVVAHLLRYPSPNISNFNVHAAIHLAHMMGICCRFQRSSQMTAGHRGSGTPRVIDICKAVGATTYINPIGGMDLYDPEDFAASGIELKFLRTTASPAQLESGPQHLSILHELMHKGVAGVREDLNRFELIVGSARNALA